VNRRIRNTLCAIARNTPHKKVREETMKKSLAIAFAIGWVLSAHLCGAQTAPSTPAPAATSTPSVPAGPAATTIPPDQQATTEQIEKLFEVMRLRKQMESMMNMMPRVVEQSYRTEMKNINAQLPPGKRIMPQDQVAAEKVMNKYMQQALSIYPVDEMIADAIPVYQRHISGFDIDTVTAFYSSPTGQRLLDEQPAIISEYMAIVMSHMQDRSKRLTDAMEAEIQQIVKPDLTDTGKSVAKPE
jgi:hypothetical protein